MGYGRGSSSSGIHMGDRDMDNVNWEDNLNLYQEMVFDAARLEFKMCSQPSSEIPNLKGGRF